MVFSYLDVWQLSAVNESGGSLYSSRDGSMPTGVGESTVRMGRVSEKRSDRTVEGGGEMERGEMLGGVV